MAARCETGKDRLYSIALRAIDTTFDGTLYLGIHTPFFYIYGYNMTRRRQSRTPQENFAIKEKVIELEAQGIETSRAIAAAFRMFRDGELNIDNAPNLTEDQQEYRREQARRRRLTSRPGSFVVDLSLMGGFIALYKRAKKRLK